MNGTTLEDFIKNYIQNKAVSYTKDGYEQWLKSNGISSEKIYADRLRSINEDYERSKSEFGANAESLAGLGLNSSGYSDYLNGKAYSEMQKQKENAKKDYTENERKNLSAYQNFITKAVSEQQKKFSSVISAIEKSQLIDYDAAYNFALSAGLSEDDAKSAAKTASDIARKKVRDSVMKQILSRNLTKSQTREYALGLGLTEKEANELSDYADSINDYVSFDEETIKKYQEYLKHKKNNTQFAEK